MTDRELLEKAAIGRLAVAEHDAWISRNAARNAHRVFLKRYRTDTGEWFVWEEAEEDDQAKFQELLKPATMAQKNLTKARAATRRAITRAAAAIGEKR